MQGYETSDFNSSADIGITDGTRDDDSEAYDNGVADISIADDIRDDDSEAYDNSIT